MFTLALSIGIYSYIIFLLGLLGFLYKETIILVSLIYLFTGFFLIRKKFNVYNLKDKIVNFVRRMHRLGLVLLSLIFIQSLVNLVGVLGPELGFDALWYHLTIPKLYLSIHEIAHIPGSLFYYSDMPKFTEMLYVSALSFGTETIAKFIHFSFGILSLIALYNLSRKFLSKTFSLLTLLLFYSNLVVGWMSVTAYIDLARTFFELMALWGFLEFQQKKESKWLIVSAVLLGLAISVKLLSIGSLLIFSILILTTFKYRSPISSIVKKLITYCSFALFIPLPWFVFSKIHTGNPFYPFFSNIYPIKLNFNLINPLNLSDPISPLYVIFLPIAVLLYRKFKPALKLVSLYCFLAIIIWYLTPQTGGGRFILPYLPVFSIVCIAVLEMMKKKKIRYVFIGIIIFLSLFSIIYRGIANLKYVPVILGKETKAQFLSDRLNFSFGDFYDTDEYFAKKIGQKDVVLLYGFHNLYYVNFPFIDSSYVKKGDMFNYIAVQGNNLPERFKFWNLIYYNDETNVKLYSIGGLKWIY